MSATPGQRAAWIAGMRTILDQLDANPDVPVDASRLFTLYLTGWRVSTPQALASWEDMLHAAVIPFSPHLRGPAIDNPAPADATYYDLDASIEGLQFRVRFSLEKVMARTVTGTRTVEDVAWVRLPVPDDEAQEGPVGE